MTPKRIQQLVDRYLPYTDPGYAAVRHDGDRMYISEVRSDPTGALSTTESDCTRRINARSVRDHHHGFMSATVDGDIVALIDVDESDDTEQPAEYEGGSMRISRARAIAGCVDHVVPGAVVDLSQTSDTTAARWRRTGVVVEDGGRWRLCAAAARDCRERLEDADERRSL